MPPEEPINFFRPGNDVFSRFSNSIPYKVGDNTFFVTGHGGQLHTPRQFIWDDRSAATSTNYYNVKNIDRKLQNLNSAYKKAVKSNGAFTLYLFVCNANDIAKSLSELHPNAYIIGANGYVMFGKDPNGKPAINGVSSEQYKNLHDRSLIIYRNGRVIGNLALPIVNP